MLYYLLTQGTKSSDYSFILENGKELLPGNKLRDLILNEFQGIDSRSKMIYNEDQTIIIRKNKDDFLIETYSSNTDRVNRKIPVELLIKDYSSKEISLKKELSNILDILKDEKIFLNEKLWFSIPFLINESVRNYHKKTRNTILLVLLALTIIITLLILVEL